MLGDPNDRYLRKTETDILIPKRIREISRKIHCKEATDMFKECCSMHPYSFFISCKEENKAQVDCLVKWFNDEELRKKVTEQYLQERSEYRRTGIPKSKSESEVLKTYY